MKKIRKGLLYIMLPVLAIMLGLGTYALTTHVNVSGGGYSFRGIK